MRVHNQGTVFGVLLLSSLEVILGEQITSDRKWYSIVGSKIISPNKDYHCSVTTSFATSIDVDISGKSISGESFNLAQSVTVEPYQTKILKFEIGPISSGDYNLTAKSDGELNISDSKILEYQAKSASIFVQTDRAIYKPGAKVQFRVLVLNPSFKPVASKNLFIFITDGKENRLKEWKQISTTKGVWSGELDISDSPVLGDWTIHVSANNQNVKKKFEVAEYVLPRFEVSANIPNNVLLSEAKIAADISAKYTHGGSVKGEATIDLEMSSPPTSLKKIISINGQAVIDIDILKEFNLEKELSEFQSKDYQSPPYTSYSRPWVHPGAKKTIKYTVTVREDLTGKTQSSSGEITLHKEKYKLDLIKSSNSMKPGLPFTVYVKVSKFDNTPVTDTDKPLKILSGYNLNYQFQNPNETEHEISSNGLSKIIFYPPRDARDMTIEGFYKGKTQRFPRIFKVSSPSGNYIQATILNEKLEINSEVEVLVELTEYTPSIAYQVIGRRDILLAGSSNVDLNSNSTKLKFLTNSSMAPKSKLIVYYIRADLEVIVDSINIEMKPVLDNFISLNTSVNELAPGEEIQLKLKTQPNSFVGLLGVDQSVLLLKKGNDITMDDVVNEIKSYNNVDKNRYQQFHRFSHTDAGRIFKDAETVVLTNGKLLEEIHFAYDEDSILRRGLPGMPMRLAGPGRIAQPMAAMIPVQYKGSFSHSPVPPSKPRLRSSFPETWIWLDFETNNDGLMTVRKKVPDTITSWVISGFSLDSSYGLGLLDTPSKIKVIRPFFISLDLPYSVIRGEVVTIPVSVFNYLDTDVTADVTLENNAAQFEFQDYADNLEPFRTKSVTIKANSGEAVSFNITATELGFISIKVVAKSQLAGDAVERKLLVKPEGETQFSNEVILVDLRKEDNTEKHIVLDVPKNFVKGSFRVEGSAVGDILGTSLQNLEKLIRMPFGCGEQNMLNFVPNIAVLDYLKNSGQLTSTVEQKCLKYMETGYQRELSYKHDDGSFSAFGNNDASGSTWLTAFVLKSFASAKPYMNIDEKVMTEGLTWLARHQAENGSFPEVGSICHKDMQGGSGQGLALTSYSLIPFLMDNTSSHTETIDKAINYIIDQFHSINNDSYSLALTTYALHKANHSFKDKAFEFLESNAEVLEQGTMKRWKRKAKKSDTDNPNALKPNSVDVEMTAYVLLTYLERGLIEESMPIMKWLLSQQNSDGGFASTQDTVVAITALSKLAERVADKNSDITVKFNYKDGSKEIKINTENTMVLQKVLLPRKLRELNVTASGKGFAVVQVSYSYNVNVNGAYPMFNLTPSVSQASTENQLLIDICSSFVAEIEGNDEDSNMVVMEVSLPSGYTVDQDSLPSLQDSPGIKRTELKEADTQVVLYFDKMTKQELCPTITAIKTHQVSNQKPVPVSVYDYYDQSRRARAFYSLPDTIK